MEAEKIGKCDICGCDVRKSKNLKLFECYDKFTVFLCAKHRNLGFKHSGNKSYYDHTEKYMIPMNILDFKILYNETEKPLAVNVGWRSFLFDF